MLNSHIWCIKQRLASNIKTKIFCQNVQTEYYKPNLPLTLENYKKKKLIYFILLFMSDALSLSIN